MDMQELSSSWLRITEFFLRKKKRVNGIYSWSRGVVFRQKFMIKYRSSMFSSRDVCIYFGKKTCALLILPCIQGLDIEMWNVSSRQFLQFSNLMYSLSLFQISFIITLFIATTIGWTIKTCFSVNSQTNSKIIVLDILFYILSKLSKRGHGTIFNMYQAGISWFIPR